MAIFLRQLFSKQFSPSIALQLRTFSSSIPISSDGQAESDAPIFDMPNPFTKDKKQCILCQHDIEVNYKNVKLLSQFQSSYTGRIYGRHITGLCKAQQERVEKEIVKAQSAGLMGYYYKEPQFLRDPELFNPERPIRPHRF